MRLVSAVLTGIKKMGDLVNGRIRQASRLQQYIVDQTRVSCEKHQLSFHPCSRESRTGRSMQEKKTTYINDFFQVRIFL